MLSFIAANTYGQASDSEITYKGEAVYLVLLDDQYNVVTTKPLGKTPYVFYDDFFKKYTVFYCNENGTQEGAVFTYVNTNTEGFIRMKQAGTIYISYSIVSLILASCPS